MHILVAAGPRHLTQLLISQLQKCGHEVTLITRDPKKYEGISQCRAVFRVILWDFQEAPLAKQKIPLNPPQVLMNLMRENLGNPFRTKKKKEKIRNSLVKASKNLLESFKEVEVSHTLDLSSIHFYGDNGPCLISEKKLPGGDFLSQVFKEHEEVFWQSEVGQQKTIFRVGHILGQKTDLLLKKKLYERSLGAKVGFGHRLFSWVHEEDVIRAFLFCLEKRLGGVYNLSAPEIPEQKKVHEMLGNAAKKRQFLIIPPFLTSILGKEGHLYFSKSVGAKSTKLQEKGFVFRYPLIHEALGNLLSKSYEAEFIL